MQMDLVFTFIVFFKSQQIFCFENWLCLSKRPMKKHYGYSSSGLLLWNKMISNLKNKRKPYVILKSSLGLHFCKSAIGRQNVPRTTTRQRADNPSYIFDCSLHINFFFSFNSFFIHNAYIVQYEDLEYNRKYSDSRHQTGQDSVCLRVINYKLFSNFGQVGVELKWYFSGVTDMTFQLARSVFILRWFSY